MEVNKYNLEFTTDMIQSSEKRLIAQIWKLIPMRENEENWEQQLQTVITEIVGLSKIFMSNPKFLILLAKLEGISTVDFMIYRKEVFESINLIHEAFQEVENTDG